MAVRTLAIIPARAGSKGIPRKNLAPVGGAPLIAYTLRAALEARGVDRTVVSTDGEAIARVARRWGIQVIRRPREISGDRSPTIDAVLHVLATLARDGIRPERVVLLQPTSPLRTGRQIDAALRLLDRRKARSLVSVSPVRQHPCECVAVGPTGRLKPAVAPPRGGAGRQDYPEYFFLNGAIYITETAMLTRRRRFWDEASVIYTMPDVHSLDIDDRGQLALVEALLASQPELAPLRTTSKGPTRSHR